METSNPPGCHKVGHEEGSFDWLLARGRAIFAAQILDSLLSLGVLELRGEPPRLVHGDRLGLELTDAELAVVHAMQETRSAC